MALDTMHVAGLAAIKVYQVQIADAKARSHYYEG
jgi:hypothetical protein